MVKYSLNHLYLISKTLTILFIVINIYCFSRSTRNIYTENLGQATASDTYILRGDPVSEIYEPTYDIFCIIHKERISISV